VSQSTADLLVAAGKGHWLKPRQGGVTAKGKGVLKSFWLDPTAKKGAASTTSSETSSVADLDLLDPDLPKTTKAVLKQGRLVDWIVELLMEHIKKIVSWTLPTGSLSIVASDPGMKSYTCFSSNLLHRLLDALPWESNKAKPPSSTLHLKDRHAWTRSWKL
jgi:hypothetical protein